MSTGEALRDEGMERVEKHANPVWVATMNDLVVQVAKSRPFFNADHTFALLADMPDPPTTHDSRAFGPVMARAQKAGICAPEPTFVKSTRPQVHANPIRVWKSLIYEGATV